MSGVVWREQGERGSGVNEDVGSIRQVPTGTALARFLLDDFGEEDLDETAEASELCLGAREGLERGVVEGDNGGVAGPDAGFVPGGRGELSAVRRRRRGRTS